ncbi:MAG: hypothetical protein Ct9H300mP1_29070 [Planctomycetaceae bacterium]|nr:MAG: hypothetical protein Ct9H300mP1_29070 [Planctomycetaceae bacterium]
MLIIDRTWFEVSGHAVRVFCQVGLISTTCSSAKATGQQGISNMISLVVA